MKNRPSRPVFYCLESRVLAGFRAVLPVPRAPETTTETAPVRLPRLSLLHFPSPTDSGWHRQNACRGARLHGCNGERSELMIGAAIGLRGPRGGSQRAAHRIQYRRIVVAVQAPETKVRRERRATEGAAGVGQRDGGRKAVAFAHAVIKRRWPLFSRLLAPVR